jgi:hypothetical protein
MEMAVGKLAGHCVKADDWMWFATSFQIICILIVKLLRFFFGCQLRRRKRYLQPCFSRQPLL